MLEAKTALDAALRTIRAAKVSLPINSDRYAEKSHFGSFLQNISDQLAEKSKFWLLSAFRF